MNRSYLIGLVGVAVGLIGLSWAEEVRFTTYYLAPYGIYNEINVIDNLGIGTTQPQASLDISGDGETVLFPRGTSDPAGTNGMIYYNSTNDKFRGYENDQWKDLIGGGAIEPYVTTDDFSDIVVLGDVVFASTVVGSFNTFSKTHSGPGLLLGGIVAGYYMKDETGSDSYQVTLTVDGYQFDYPSPVNTFYAKDANGDTRGIIYLPPIKFDTGLNLTFTVPYGSKSAFGLLYVKPLP